MSGTTLAIDRICTGIDLSIHWHQSAALPTQVLL
ncbi:conserved hypothetical protein [Verticillium alfalfae VaMs.102]|uniref:Uncharacterized protein n=1 Tax=Verticillium alfalfae (strain VaMs.102 / ATCC MYA-4576 / FGSC 10136) TaxID=526221 RepID=C9SKC6_VERA1|nr:conserved hypothetical protein [Verticillium alfalfae VaMs.102]EEY19144.1 conserved hypothetical protein [Verticillium alfalfae VaMs.102]